MMFDATRGEAVFKQVYAEVLLTKNPAIWYEGGYITWECWYYAAGCALTNLFDNCLVDNEDKTDLMAYICECNPDNIDTVFGDGFGYLLGCMMQNEYEIGE